MNRRTILSSLSSMVVAALGWPRQAEAKSQDRYYTTKLYNGSYVSNKLVPGQIPINASVYEGTAVTMLGGATATFNVSALKLDSITAEVSASRASGPSEPTNASFGQTNGGSYPSQNTIYVLISAKAQGDLTITQAPKGVTW